MKFSLLILVFALAVSRSQAQYNKTLLRLAQYNLSGNKLALEGYDPVAYFSGKAKKGIAANSLNYQGVIYNFASQQNKDAFQKAPSQYEPQNGGWCAYAMGNDGSKVEVDPETFKIVGGKLYLFYNSFFNNTLKSWNKAEARLMKSADASWRKFYW